ncbi:MAG: MATE family efflux transporter [Clostridia bacterium]|nr:MATE family efflux transporter [Clostridia bacterium]
MKVRNYEMDMTAGSLPKKMISYALPFIATGALQLLLNTADVIVVGRFAGETSLAAVGSTTSLINLLVNLFMGLSVGVGVLVAQNYGSNKYNDVSETVHTAFCVSLICGVLVGIVGFTFAKPMLHLMGSPDDVIDLATLYLKIYFCGTPAFLFYNFLSAVLRAVGDTRRPLFYLGTSGLLNIILNLIFVIVFHMGVAGVAIATVASQVLSSILILRCLRKTTSCYHLDYSQARIHWNKFWLMFKIGLPAGIQSSLFSISNVIIQSSINSWGSLVMAGNSAAQSIEGFTYTAMNSISQTALAFTGQNIGAGKIRNVKRIALWAILYVTVIGLFMGGVSYLLGEQLLFFFTSDAQVIHYGIIRLLYVCLPYFICGVMDVMVGILRGMGYSLIPMIISIGGVCGFRVIWIFTVYQQFHYLETIYLSYPITWTITAIIQAICLTIILIRKKKHTDKIASEDATI